MNKEYDYFYKILGIKPGATLAEIKAAYRSLAKQYHPDHDQSPDAVIMYKEIHAAYKALLDMPLNSGTNTGTTVNRNYSKRTAQASNQNYSKSRQSAADNQDSSKQATWASKEWDIWAKQAKWNSENWAKEYFNNSSVRLPFELKNLFSIFFRSLIELFSDIYFIVNVILVWPFVYWSCGASRFSTSLQPYSGLALLYYVATWIFFIYFRYYFHPSAWAFLLRAVAGILYGAVLVFLIACFYTISGEYLFFTGLWSASSVWFLLSDPKVIFKRV